MADPLQVPNAEQLKELAQDDAPKPVPGARSPAHRWKDWRAQGTEAPSASAAQRRNQIITLAVVVVVLAGLVAALVSYLLRQDPRMLVVTVPFCQYEDRWPIVNPFAENEIDVLTGRDGKGRRLFLEMRDNDREDAFVYQQLGEFDRMLDSLGTKKQYLERPLLLHLNGMAVSRGGELYLLPINAEPGDVKTWKSVRDVLTAVDGLKAPRKFLVLDLAHPFADPFRGVVYNDASDRLDALLREFDPKFPVLTSCSPGEFSYPLDEEETSVFLHYFAEGLAGAADGYPDAERKTQVRVIELSEYVRDHVNRWVNMTRGASQTPKLYGAAGQERFAVNYLDDPAVKFEPRWGDEAAPRLLAYPAWLSKGWELRDKWRAEQVHRLSPRLTRHLEQALLRAEQLWHYGTRQRRSDLERTTAEAIARLEGEREKLAAQQVPLALSLARLAGSRKELFEVKPAEGKGAEKRVKLAYPDKLAALFDRLPGLLPLKRAPDNKFEGEEKAGEERAKALAEFLDAVPPAFFNEALGDLWREVVTRPADGNLRRYAFYDATFAELLRRAGNPTLAEPLYLRRVAERANFYLSIVDPDTRAAALAAFEQALKTEAAGQSALALLRPDSFPWVQGLLEDADGKQRAGEKRLFAAEEQFVADLARAKGDLADAEKLYVQAGDLLGTVQGASRAAEDAWAELPALFDYLMALPQPEEKHVAAWGRLRANAEAIGDLLARDPQAAGAGGPGGLVSQLEGLAGQVKFDKDLDAVRKEFDVKALEDRLAKLEKSDPAAADYQHLRNLLAAPLLRADHRKKAWEISRAIGEALHKQIKEADGNEYAARIGPNRKSTVIALKPVERDVGLGAELGRGNVRAKLVVEATKQADPEWARDPRRRGILDLPPQVVGQAGRERLDKAAAELLAFWGSEAPKRLRPFETAGAKDKRDAKTDRLLAALRTFDRNAESVTQQKPSMTEARDRGPQEQALMTWLSEKIYTPRAVAAVASWLDPRTRDLRAQSYYNDAAATSDAYRRRRSQ